MEKITLKQFFCYKFFSVLFAFFLALFVAILLGRFYHVEAAGTQPTLGFPYPSGTAVGMGTSGLHGCNFSSLPGYTFTDSNTDDSDSYCHGGNPITDASLDVGFTGHTGKSSVPAVALGVGKVLNVWPTCGEVLIDYGNGWWGYYIHLDQTSIAVSNGQNVNTGETIGYPTTNVNTGSPCYEYSSFTHVHFAFLNETGSNTATFVSMAGMTLCGLQVLPNSEATNGYDNFEGEGTNFTVPTCPSVTSTPTPTPTPSPEPPHISITSGITPSSSTPTMGSSFSASWTVTSDGGSTFSYSGLRTLAIDPQSGSQSVINSHGSGSLSAGSYSTINDSTSSFLSSCTGSDGTTSVTCGFGTYTVYAQYEDSGGTWYDIDQGSGGTTPVTITADQTPNTMADTVVKNDNGDLVAFTPDGSGNIKEDRDTSGTYAGWYTLFSGTTTLSKIAAVQFASNAMAIFYRGTDNKIYNSWMSTPGVNNSWVTPVSMGTKTFVGDPVAINQGNGLVDVFARDTNDDLYHDYQVSGGSWSGWTELISGTVIPSDPSVMLLSNGAEAVFVRGMNGSIYNTWEGTAENESTWTTTWSLIGTTSNFFAGNPIPVVQSDGYTDVFARGTDNDLYHDYQNSSGVWSGWTELISGTDIPGDPSAILLSGGSLAVFVRGTSGNIYNAWEQTAGSETSWSSWNTVGSTTPTFTADPLVYANSIGGVDVYTNTSSPTPYYDSYNGSSWTNWQTF